MKKETVVDWRDRYDGVFHLVTAANGKEEFYTTANNLARRESAEEAREQDGRIQEAWLGHPHLRVIDNSRSLRPRYAACFRKSNGFSASR